MAVDRMEIETLDRFSSADKVSGEKAECFQTRKVVSYAMLSDTDQEQAWQQLEILAREHDFRERLTQEVITSLIEHYSEARAAHRGCRSLMILASHGADHVALRGGIDAVVKAMRSHRSGASRGCVQVVGCGALCSFAQHKENVCGPTSEQIGAMVDAVVSALSGSPWWDTTTNSWGCLALNQFARRFPLTVARHGGTVAVLSAMRHHLNHADVQECGARALLSISGDPAGKLDVARHGGVDTLLASLAAHLSTPTVLQSTLQTIAALARDEALRAMVGALGGARAVMHAMEHNAEHAGVQAHALHALAVLARSPDTRCAVAAAGVNLNP